MGRTGRTLILAALLVALAGACAASRGSLKDAEEALAAEEYDRAHAIYSRILAGGDADPLTRQRARLARQRARDEHLDLAMRHLARAEFEPAKKEVAVAGRISPKDPVVKSAAEAIEQRKGWLRDGTTRAKRLLDLGLGSEALALLRDLERVFPGASFDTHLGRAKELVAREEAEQAAAEKRRIIEDVLARAEAAWSLGEAGAAVEVLEEGRARVGDAPELLGGAAAIRSGTASRLLERADGEQKGGRVAAALLFARAALRADPSSGEARRRVEDLAARLSGELDLKVRLDPLVDRTHRADPGTFSRRVLGRADAPFVRVSSAEPEPDLVVSGDISAVEVDAPAPTVQRKSHRYVVRSDFEVNPEFQTRRERVETLRREYDDARAVWSALNDEREELERLRLSGATVRNRRRYFGNYDEVIFLRLLSDARRRETEERREKERLERELERAERSLDRVPYYLESRVFGTASYEVRTAEKRARASATLRFAGTRPEEPKELAAEVHVSDRGHDGIPAAELAPDPLEIPSDGEMADRAITDLAGKAAAEILDAVSRSRLGLVSEARRLEAAGDVPAALDRHAAFLVATEGRLPLERASSARRIRDAFGIDLTGGTMDLSRLRID